MRLLFDHNVPAPLRALLPAHDVTFAKNLGWGALSNGALLAAAESGGVALLVTADKNMRYQQNLSGRRIAIVVLPSQNMGMLRDGISLIEAAINQGAPGGYQEIDLPRPARVRRPTAGPREQS
jgi:predicted nuclease of predicted toxin-antitoxin system